MILRMKSLMERGFLGMQQLAEEELELIRELRNLNDTKLK